MKIKLPPLVHKNISRRPQTFKPQNCRRLILHHVLVLALLALLASLIACAPTAPKPAGPIYTITDSVGRSVDVPQNPQSICCVCPFTGPILVMLDAGDKITSCCHNMSRSTLLNLLCPSLKDSVLTKNSGSINAEEILRLSTDLIFIDQGTYLIDDEKAKLENMGIPYVVIGFDDLASQLDAIEVIGNALGQQKKAVAYIEWCRQTYDSVAQTSAANRTDLRLYHAVNEAVRTDSANSICAEWIALTGVTNVSVDSELTQDGDKSFTTLEQIYNWDPDLIIANESTTTPYILTDSKWAGLRCVREGKVFQIPVGIARMGHPTSTETPLGLIWLENLIYPEAYPVDYKQVLKDYYKDFYDYEIDDELVKAIIEGTDMRDTKSVKGN